MNLRNIKISLTKKGCNFFATPFYHKSLITYHHLFTVRSFAVYQQGVVIRYCGNAGTSLPLDKRGWDVYICMEKKLM